MISLVNSCDYGCGICFKKEKMYLVYAYRDYSTGGYLKTNGCTRTRQIHNDSFITSNAYDPDYGKDENKELDILVQRDTTPKYLYQYDSTLNLQMELLHSQLKETNEKLDSRTTLLYWMMLGITLTVLIILYMLRRMKRTNNT
ncbi:hypothetical protein R9C00_16790 [Flammeovirgaceae bacterium SG7u.111]|nr:hypothetical protein [Flammeovirgaceae bacterium SG7u.132]WPO33359.1 hypothetical protein R9C00_16790 [Flammeovirgaceae bacterium SG7u.111]